MRVLVTGGNGFIGSYTMRRLRALGCDPVAFDRYGPSKEDGREFPHFGGDVRDRAAVYDAVYASDAVIHLAGVLGTQETIIQPESAIETNIFGSMNVFQACATHGKRCVYIAVGNHWMNNPYSITKTTAERFALMMNRERGTKIAIVRGLNAYGPGQKHAPVRKIIPNMIRPALLNEAITIYGDGSQIMDMIYVEDLARILCNALIVDHGVYDRAFEAGTGRQTSVLEIAEEVIRQVGFGSVKHVPMRPGEPEHSVVLGDPATLRPLYDGQDAPLLSLETGIYKTIGYYATELARVDKAERAALHA